MKKLEMLDYLFSSQKPYALFLGAGGSASANLVFEASLNPQVNFVFLSQTYDDGGGTGLIRECFPDKNEGLVGAGDIRNAVGVLLSNSESNKLRILGDRLNQYVTHDNVRYATESVGSLFQILSDYDIPIDVSESDLQFFVHSYFERYTMLPERKRFLNGVEIKQKIGNLLFAFLEFKLGSVMSLTNLLWQIEIIPTNLFFVPLTNYPLELINRNETIVRGEGNIDLSQTKFDISSYFLIKPSTRDGQEHLFKYSNKNKIIQKLIKNSSSITLLPTSLENYLPIIDLYIDDIKYYISTGKLIYNWMPSIYSANYSGAKSEISFLQSRFARSIKYLFPSVSYSQNDVYALIEISNRYGLEGKRIPAYTYFYDQYKGVEIELGSSLASEIIDYTELGVKIKDNLDTIKKAISDGYLQLTVEMRHDPSLTIAAIIKYTQKI